VRRPHSLVLAAVVAGVALAGGSAGTGCAASYLIDGDMNPVQCTAEMACPSGYSCEGGLCYLADLVLLSPDGGPGPEFRPVDQGEGDVPQDQPQGVDGDPGEDVPVGQDVPGSTDAALDQPQPPPQDFGPDGPCNGQAPSNFNQPCGSCGGLVQCDGTCSVTDPTNLGQACENCGGTVQCDGTCSVNDPANFGQACGQCGGTVKCDGTCSVATPGNFGQSCNACGGTIHCNGSCSPACPACTTCTRANGTCGNGGIASECGVNGDACRSCVSADVDYCTTSGGCNHCLTCKCTCSGTATCKFRTFIETVPDCTMVCSAFNCSVNGTQNCASQCPPGGA
jgi:hypothetical protein